MKYKKIYDIFYSGYLMNKYGKVTKSRRFYTDGTYEWVILKNGKPYKKGKIRHGKDIIFRQSEKAFQDIIKKKIK